MERDKEGQVEHTVEGMTYKFSLPERAGRPTGICRFRDKLVICTEYGHVYMWDDDRGQLSQVASIWP